MGRDKALLPHPSGGTWLEHGLALLALQGAPLTLLSRHPAHGALARAWAHRSQGTGHGGGGPELTVVLEPPPWQGPLLALARLMEHHPEERLLLCPVDMPWLDAASVAALLAASSADPGRIHAAHDGSRLQPLLGVYPADGRHRRSLAAFTGAGGRSLQRWLAAVGPTAVVLPAGPLRNANRPADLAALGTPGDGPVDPALAPTAERAADRAADRRPPTPPA